MNRGNQRKLSSSKKVESPLQGAIAHRRHHVPNQRVHHALRTLRIYEPYQGQAVGDVAMVDLKGCQKAGSQMRVRAKGR